MWNNQVCMMCWGTGKVHLISIDVWVDCMYCRGRGREWHWINEDDGNITPHIEELLAKIRSGIVEIMGICKNENLGNPD
jgi:hypothetical protein